MESSRHVCNVHHGWRNPALDLYVRSQRAKLFRVASPQSQMEIANVDAVPKKKKGGSVRENAAHEH
jgi:hypothetical protein